MLAEPEEDLPGDGGTGRSICLNLLEFARMGENSLIGFPRGDVAIFCHFWGIWMGGGGVFWFN
jgi:hypothetical protein